MLFYGLRRFRSPGGKQETGPRPTCLGTKKGPGPKIGKLGTGAFLWQSRCLYISHCMAFIVDIFLLGEINCKTIPRLKTIS